MIGFLVTFVISMTVSYLIGQALMRPKGMKRAPTAFEIPNVEEGRIYPVVFGTPKRIIDPSIVWWGDLKVVAITKKVSGGLFHSDKKVVTGHKYFVGLHMILCHGPIDGIKQIYMREKLIWPNPDDPSEMAADNTTSISLDANNLFGGNDSEGGIQGDIDIEYGFSGQIPNTYLVSQLGSDITASLGLVGVVFKQVYLGTSPYLKSPAFLCKRIQRLDDGTAQWYSAKAAINNDMNPAHILRECYTNTRWGLGHSTDLFDDGDWQAVADQLYAEDFGLSCLWEGDQTLEDFIIDVLRHINGIIYQEPLTGQFVLKLIRDDYALVDLETFSASDGIIRLEEFSRPSLGIIPDQLYVEYWDVIHNKKAIVPNHDPSILDLQGKPVPETMEFNFITRGSLAQKVAARERAVISSMLSTMTVVANRKMAHLRPGSVFILSWPALGISQMVLRAIEIDYGLLTNGEIRLTCTEDVWAAQESIYSDPVPSEWVSPISAPSNVTAVVVSELPLYPLILEWGLSAALDFGSSAGYLGICAAAPTGDAFDYQLWVRDTGAGSFTLEGQCNWTPNALIANDLPKNAANATITLNNGYNLAAVNAGSYALVDDEICEIVSTNLAVNQITIARGLMDTVPEFHNAGARMWFIGSILSLVARQYTDGDEPAAKLLTRTGKGTLAIGSATIFTASAFDSRAARPYPPGCFRINNVSYPSSFSGQPTISWTHRDRTQQTSLVRHSAASIGPEATTTYTLEIYDQSNNLVRTETGLSGTSYTYLEVDERSDCGLGALDPLNTSLRFRLWSVRDAYTSWQRYDLTVNRT